MNTPEEAGSDHMKIKAFTLLQTNSLSNDLRYYGGCQKTFFEIGRYNIDKEKEDD